MLGLAACVHAREPEGRVDPVIANAVLTSAAAQVRRCYRSPTTSSASRRIITRLAVHLNPDGSLAALPVVLGQSGVDADNGAEAPRMAEAASLAVIRCAPLRLPPEQYALIWRSIELTFSPLRRV
jgi:glycosyltransferase A (GT-A) superfamily protein (DUF2064 family)